MLAAYPLRINKLSSTLEQELLEYASAFVLDTGYDPNQVFSEDDWNACWTFHKETNTKESKYKAFAMPVDLQQKVKTELTDDPFPFSWFDVRFQIVTDGDALCPHRDSGRRLNILYNITEDNAITEFYNKRVADDVRYVFSMQELDGPVEVHCFNPHTWYVFNNQRVHLVKNSRAMRIAVNVDIDRSFEEFYHYFRKRNVIDLDYQPKLHNDVNYSETHCQLIIKKRPSDQL